MPTLNQFTFKNNPEEIFEMMQNHIMMLVDDFNSHIDYRLDVDNYNGMADFYRNSKAYLYLHKNSDNYLILSNGMPFKHEKNPFTNPLKDRKVLKAYTGLVFKDDPEDKFAMFLKNNDLSLPFFDDYIFINTNNLMPKTSRYYGLYTRLHNAYNNEYKMSRIESYNLYMHHIISWSSIIFLTDFIDNVKCYNIYAECYTEDGLTVL